MGAQRPGRKKCQLGAWCRFRRQAPRCLCVCVGGESPGSLSVVRIHISVDRSMAWVRSRFCSSAFFSFLFFSPLFFSLLFSSLLSRLFLCQSPTPPFPPALEKEGLGGLFLTKKYSTHPSCSDGSYIPPWCMSTLASGVKLHKHGQGRQTPPGSTFLAMEALV